MFLSLWWVEAPSQTRPAQRCQPFRSLCCGQQWVNLFLKFIFLVFLLNLHLIYLFILLIARSMYVFGGFSGMLLNDVLVYRPPSCQAFVAEESCVQAGPGFRCIWSRGRCFPWEPSMANGNLTLESFCPTKPGKKDSQTSAYFIFYDQQWFFCLPKFLILHSYVF